ncbi:MAG: ROK family protein [Bacteroidota bacterium]
MNGEVIGIDLGGTNFKIGIVKNGQVNHERQSAVNSTMDEGELLEILYQLIDDTITSETKAIGIGVPGIVDPDAGVIYDIQNLPAWKEVPLLNLLEDRYNVSVCLNNDANCFALGEKMYGDGKSYQNLIGLSIGTGIGMGVIIRDQLYHGEMCGAGEIAMIPYKDGIIESYASSFFFSDHYQKSGKEMYEMAKRGEPIALDAFREFGIHLGETIKIILYLFAPEAIILGGSISKAHVFFQASLESTVATFLYPKQVEHLQIMVSNRSNLPILGAAALCL